MTHNSNFVQENGTGEFNAAESFTEGSFTDESFIDAKSGISEEEQRDILKRINSITEKNRQSLASGMEAEDGASGRHKKNAGKFAAKKKGYLFPIIVNTIAAAGLVAGILVLSLTQRRVDEQAREGNIVYSSSERVLINEIRRETFSRVAEKENEISQIKSQLSEIDSMLEELYSTNEELTAEQRAAENRLIAEREKFNVNLSDLENERAQILEEYRAKEAFFKEQLENRSRELTQVSEQSAADIDSARAEMERLSSEYYKSQAVEDQITANLVKINNNINEKKFDDALKTIQSTREFINTPGFQSLRAIETKKELYNQALNSYQGTIEELMRIIAAAGRVIETEKNIADLTDRYGQLENELTERQSAIETFSTEGAAANKRIADLTAEINTLRSINNALESSSTQKDGQIRTLTQNSSDKDSQIRNLTQSSSDKDNQIRTLTQSAADKDNQIRTLTQNSTDKDNQIRTLTQNSETARQSAANLQTEVAALNRTVSGNENTIRELRQQITSNEQTIANLTTQVADMRQAIINLQQYSE